MLSVDPNVAILNEHISTLKETLQTLEEFIELIRAQRSVVFSPPDVLLILALSDNVLVIWRSSRLITGVDGNCA